MLDFWTCFLCTDLLDAWNGFHKAHLCGVTRGTWPANHPDHLNNPRICEDWYEYLSKKKGLQNPNASFPETFWPLSSRHTHICHLSTWSAFPLHQLGANISGNPADHSFQSRPNQGSEGSRNSVQVWLTNLVKMGALLMEIWTKMISLVLLYNTHRVSSTFQMKLSFLIALYPTCCV